jgi:hypothetical protein
MSINDYIQYGIVILILALVIFWIIKRTRKNNSTSCNCGCSGCSMSDRCDKDSKKVK